MRLAIYYDNLSTGRNDGNPLYVTAALKRISIYGNSIVGNPVKQEDVNRWCRKEDKLAFSIAKKWADRGHVFTIDHLLPYKSLSHDLVHDAHIWVDWGEDGLTSILPENVDFPKSPLIYWASDTHLGYDYRLSVAKKSDVVFCAQLKGVEDMKKDGVNDPLWLPHAVEPLAYPKTDWIQKKYDVCFVGHVNSQNRIDALDRLFKEVPNFFWGQRRFEDAADIFGISKIVFNIAMKDDLNMRTFEAMGTGSCLLTDRIPTIEDLFIDGKEIVLYDNFDDMVEKAKYYIEHDNERQSIAEAGYKKIMNGHTILHRVDMMLEEIVAKKGIKEEVHVASH